MTYPSIPWLLLHSSVRLLMTQADPTTNGNTAMRQVMPNSPCTSEEWGVSNPALYPLRPVTSSISLLQADIL